MSTRTCVLIIAAISLSLWGCGSEPDARQFGDQDNVTNVAPPDAHQHPAHGPNGGHVLELGEHAYHAELVMDPASRNVVVHVLDHDMATAMPVAATSVTLNLEGAEPISLIAAPQPGEPEGQSSKFEVGGDQLPETVKTEEDLHGSVVLTVGDQSHSGSISHAHGHEHDDDHAHEGDHRDDDHDHKGEHGDDDHDSKQE